MGGTSEIRTEHHRPTGARGSAGAEWKGTVRSKSFAFELSIVRVHRTLVAQREYVISKQLLRSGTSIGANVEEAAAASSRRDFLHKISIASKEARESLYWLRLVDQSELVPGIDVSREKDAAEELVRMLTAIVKTTSRTLQSEKRPRSRN